jgi:hypothetical protein
MSRNYKFYNSNVTFFFIFAVQSWVDVFTRNDSLVNGYKESGLQ